MFLVYIYASLHIIECVLSFIENNSVLVGVITSVIVSSLWLRKFIRQKRAEAFFGFYARLSLCLKALQTNLEDKELLNVSDSKKGNIYSLIYIDDYIKDVCPSFTVLTEDELKVYKNFAIEIEEILLNTDNNVYPKKANTKKWYESQHILFSFCEFLKNKEYHHTTNIAVSEGSTEPKHIEKCKALVEAINFIQVSIDNAKY